MANLTQNVTQTIDDFNSIQTVLEEKKRNGGDLTNVPTSEYADLIRQLPNIEGIYFVSTSEELFNIPTDDEIQSVCITKDITLDWDGMTSILIPENIRIVYGFGGQKSINWGGTIVPTATQYLSTIFEVFDGIVFKDLILDFYISIENGNSMDIKMFRGIHTLTIENCYVGLALDELTPNHDSTIGLLYYNGPVETNITLKNSKFTHYYYPDTSDTHDNLEFIGVYYRNPSTTSINRSRVDILGCEFTCDIKIKTISDWMIIDIKNSFGNSSIIRILDTVVNYHRVFYSLINVKSDVLLIDNLIVQAIGGWSTDDITDAVYLYVRSDNGLVQNSYFYCNFGDVYPENSFIILGTNNNVRFNNILQLGEDYVYAGMKDCNNVKNCSFRSGVGYINCFVDDEWRQGASQKIPVGPTAEGGWNMNYAS